MAPAVSGPTIDEIVVADEAERWRAVGFEVGPGETCAVGTVRLRFAGAAAGSGIVGWSLRGLGSLELDGLPTSLSEREPPAVARHPNGVELVDHVVVFSPDLDRTIAAFEAARLPLRRLREGPTPGGAMRQGFFRLGEVILEVIEEPDAVAQRAGGRDRPAKLWGLSFVVCDIEAAAAELGERAGPVRAAVQEGRRIMPLRRAAGLGVPIAFMTPGRGAA